MPEEGFQRILSVTRVLELAEAKLPFTSLHLTMIVLIVLRLCLPCRDPKASLNFMQIHIVKGLHIFILVHVHKKYFGKVTNSPKLLNVFFFWGGVG